MPDALFRCRRRYRGRLGKLCLYTEWRTAWHVCTSNDLPFLLVITTIVVQSACLALLETPRQLRPKCRYEYAGEIFNCEHLHISFLSLKIFYRLVVQCFVLIYILYTKSIPFSFQIIIIFRNFLLFLYCLFYCYICCNILDP